MNANGVRQILLMVTVNLTLFLAYCIAALYLPVGRLIRYLKHTKRP
jgi:hypothetical protein